MLALENRVALCLAFIVIMCGSAAGQVLPQVCTLRGTLGAAPSAGATGLLSTVVSRPGSPTATCSGVTPPNPFNGAAGSYRYNVHYLTNPTIFPICVPVRLAKTNPSVSGADLQLSVFQAPFTATDITNSARFRGDAGASTGAFSLAQPTNFNVVVPGGSSVALVVYNLVNGSPAAEPYQIDFCTRTTAYSNSALAIPDNNPAGINATIQVPTSGTISDINFRFTTGSPACDATTPTNAAVGHSYVGDLIFRLVAPDGATRTVMNRQGGTRENICSVLLDDDGGFPSLSTITNQTGLAVAGNYNPDDRLSGFDGRSAQGTWTLNVSDNEAEDTGTVRRFALEITTYPYKAPFDYDGDLRSDLSIYRPAPGEWWYLKSSDGGNAAFQFGNSSDRIVPGDYTGDGKTDIAFWRPSTGEWYILRTEDFSFYSVPFGASGDVPVPGDYDGDTFADIAIFRPSSNTWFINKSSGGTDIVGFGSAGDKPVQGDYDGDGKVDIAIFRPNGPIGGQWWGINSRNGTNFTFTFGTPTDKPVPADYTGDGRTDIAVWRPSTGVWYILRSGVSTFYSVPFGANGDVPVPGDYDGDGNSDIAVFRPSSSTWFIERSTAGTLIQTFGAVGDYPTPNSLLPQ